MVICLSRATKSVTLLEVLDRLLDKGVVIIGEVRIAVDGVDLLELRLIALLAAVDKIKALGSEPNPEPVVYKGYGAIQT